ncbi:DUF3429 domain-containing protein [Vibrio sp. RC27]
MRTIKILGFMGLIPLFASLYLSINDVAWQLESKQAFMAYSAIILSFVAGTLWKNQDQQINKIHLTHTQQNYISNIFSLFAFLALLVNQHLGLAILATNFLALFLYESRLAKVTECKESLKGYLAMRLQLTVIVILLQLTALIVW